MKTDVECMIRSKSPSSIRVWVRHVGPVRTCTSHYFAPSPYLPRLNDSDFMVNHQMENDGFSDKSEREAHEDWDTPANENGGRLTEESDMDQADDLSPGLQATPYVEQGLEEMAEVRGSSVVLICATPPVALVAHFWHNVM